MLFEPEFLTFLIESVTSYSMCRLTDFVRDVQREAPVVYFCVLFSIIWNIVVGLSIIRKIFRAIVDVYISQLLTALIIFLAVFFPLEAATLFTFVHLIKFFRSAFGLLNSRAV